MEVFRGRRRPRESRRGVMARAARRQTRGYRTGSCRDIRESRVRGKHAAGKKYAMHRGGAAHPFVLANCPGTQPAGSEPEYDSGSVTPRRDRPGGCRRRRTRELSDMTRRDAKARPQHTRDAAMDFVLCPAPYHSFKREIFDGVAGLPCPYGGRTASGIPRLSGQLQAGTNQVLHNQTRRQRLR